MNEYLPRHIENSNQSGIVFVLSKHANGHSILFHQAPVFSHYNDSMMFKDPFN